MGGPAHGDLPAELGQFIIFGSWMGGLSFGAFLGLTDGSKWEKKANGATRVLLVLSSLLRVAIAFLCLFILMFTYQATRPLQKKIEVLSSLRTLVMLLTFPAVVC